MVRQGGEGVVRNRAWEVKVKVRWRFPRGSCEDPAITGAITMMEHVQTEQETCCISRKAIR
jgi:hypothetical protein